MFCHSWGCGICAAGCVGGAGSVRRYLLDQVSHLVHEYCGSPLTAWRALIAPLYEVRGACVRAGGVSARGTGVRVL